MHQVRYFFCLISTDDDLKNEEINLKLAEDRIKQEVEREKRNTKETGKDVEKWIVDVDNVVEEVERLKEETQTNRIVPVLIGRCPNWAWRYFRGLLLLLLLFSSSQFYPFRIKLSISLLSYYTYSKAK